jgi:hypothetical protein
MGEAKSTTVVVMPYMLPVPMRVTPTAFEYGGSFFVDYGGAGIAVTPGISGTFSSNNRTYVIDFTGTGITQFRPYVIENTTDGTTYFGFSAEL